MPVVNEVNLILVSTLLTANEPVSLTLGNFVGELVKHDRLRRFMRERPTGIRWRPKATNFYFLRFPLEIRNLLRKFIMSRNSILSGGVKSLFRAFVALPRNFSTSALHRK
jgi:hypothetical protein